MKTQKPKKRAHAATQCDRLLAALMRGERITRLESITRYKILNTWQRVRELRDAGHEVLVDYETRNGARVAVYYMQPKTNPEGLPA